MDSLFGLDGVAPHDANVELLVTVDDNVQLALVKGLLESEQIPYLVKERGSGSSVKIISGFSLYGTDVFVQKECLDKARELLDAYMNAPDGEEAPDAEDEPEDETGA